MKTSFVKSGFLLSLLPWAALLLKSLTGREGASPAGDVTNFVVIASAATIPLAFGLSLTGRLRGLDPGYAFAGMAISGVTWGLMLFLLAAALVLRISS
jgi:hypothetical protein